MPICLAGKTNKLHNENLIQGGLKYIFFYNRFGLDHLQMLNLQIKY